MELMILVHWAHHFTGVGAQREFVNDHPAPVRTTPRPLASSKPGAGTMRTVAAPRHPPRGGGRPPSCRLFGRARVPLQPPSLLPAEGWSSARYTNSSQLTIPCATRSSSSPRVHGPHRPSRRSRAATRQACTGYRRHARGRTPVGWRAQRRPLHVSDDNYGRCSSIGRDSAWSFLGSPLANGSTCLATIRARRYGNCNRNTSHRLANGGVAYADHVGD